MSVTRVSKRTGEVVPFDATRIHQAIAAAVEATRTPVADREIALLVDAIQSEIAARFFEFFPNVENIQDIVEKHLVRAGHYEVAKGYILYRAERTRVRLERRAETVERAQLGKLTVVTREGQTVLFNFRRIEEVVELATAALQTDISPDRVAREVTKSIFDGISTVEIGNALVMAAATFIERDPAYAFVTARLLLRRLYRESFGQSALAGEAKALYRASFVDGIATGIAAELFDSRLRRFDLDLLAASLRPERDRELQFMGLQTLAERYLVRHGERRIELPQGFWMRVAMGLAIAEPNPDERALEFYELMSTLRYVPSTPTLFHAGTTRPQLSSCYLTTVDDDLGQIFKNLGDNAQLSKWSGGLGNDWTNIRATNSPIRSTNVESQGVIPFLKIANDVTMAINRSGKRRGATCAYLETWHLDIEDFLDLRKNTGDERRRTHDMNTANWIPDLFMKRVEEGGDWTLFSPDEVPDLHQTYGRDFERRYVAYEERAARGELRLHRKVEAKVLWRKMLTLLFETGHPWITFKDPCNVRSPQDHVGVVHSSNLCTEITLNTSREETAVCNLGSVNLQRHVQDGRLDEPALARTVRTAIRMLDNVVDINYYPTEEARTSNLRHRPIGLGIMGFQDALFELDLAFESPEALELADRSMEWVAQNAILASAELAAERGAYPTFAGSKWSRGLFPQDTLALLEAERGRPLEVDRVSRYDWSGVREKVALHGMRNSNTMAIAPTATISNIAGCFPCFEPIYKNLYVKANISGEFTVVNRYLVDDLKRLGLWSGELLDQLKYTDGDVERIAAVPEKLQRKYREAFAIDPIAALRLTAARGKWIDQSQSHNVFLRGVSGKLLSEIYLAAWRMGLKTTYYLRTMAATQIEKSTLDAGRFGFTQKREYGQVEVAASAGAETSAETPEPQLCRIEDPDCEACQ
ncbi:MAG: ribonucleoside-diphosphate reductase subunit alpha [Thermoanaerobaculia bacterium]